MMKSLRLIALMGITVPLLSLGGTESYGNAESGLAPPYDKPVYMGMAFARCYEQPSGFSRPLAFVSFGVEFQVIQKIYEWLKVEAVPGNAETVCYLHETSIVDYETMSLLLSGMETTPEEYSKSLGADAAEMGTSEFSERSASSFATKGFTERPGLSFATKGFSERSASSFATKGFSERSSLSFATKGFSERSASSFATKGFSERSSSSFATKGFSERSSSSFATKGFSERSSSSFATKGFSEDEENGEAGTAAPVAPPTAEELIDRIMDSTSLSFIDPHQELMEFRKEGNLGEYKW